LHREGRKGRWEEGRARRDKPIWKPDAAYGEVGTEVCGGGGELGRVRG